MAFRCLLAWLAWMLIQATTAIAESPSAPLLAPVEFSRDIRPIFAEHCLRCHGPDKAEGTLNLSDRQSATHALESGETAIVPLQPDASELLRRVTAANRDERMPPEGKPLAADQTDKLRRWIAQGADYQTHWAFRPLQRPPVPAVRQAAWVRNPIDAFVLARLEAQGISPSNEASRSTLIKRLHLDLLGLLPKPDEVHAFINDESPRAYEKLVDRLLASPHFGERWGRHWLDMARYADSDGYEKDRARPDAFVFRDWVIDALNRDLPFDQFTIEQLAGDLLSGATASQRIATAFNRQTLTNEEGGVDQEEYRVAAVFDRTDTLGSVWLGLTVGCARCHNHKYDEILQREYYQLFSFFNDADEVAVPLPIKATDLPALESALRPLEAALAARKHELAPREYQWEEAERSRIESTPNKPLKVEPLDIASIEAVSGTRFAMQADGSQRVVELATVAEVPADKTPGDLLKPGEPAKPTELAKTDELAKTVEAPGSIAPSVAASDTDRYTITASAAPAEITGFRLESVPDPALPKKGAGRAASGNFVVTWFQAFIVDANGQPLRTLPLQHATADFQQQGFKAADALNTSANPKKGWAVSPKVEAPHYLQVRLPAPLTLGKDERLQFVIDQDYGGSHALGRFRLRAITGDAAGLNLPTEVVAALRMYPEKRVALTQNLLFDHFASQDPQVRELQEKIDATHRLYKSQLMQVRTVAAALRERTTHRFDRGDFLSPAEEVSSGTLHVLPPLAFGAGASGGDPSANVSRRANRLDLARWLVGHDNPLTPRVVSNQVWARLFGAGIVHTPSDFGARGDLPTHPELLDWLAATYQRDLAWSTKAFLKTILMSSTYRQASTHRAELTERDPRNTLLYRQNRLRVEGELVRDLALEVGGLLSSKVGGPSVFPPMPADLAKLSYANSFSWTDSVGDDRYRRGMYTFFKRTIPHPTLMTFDCPDANVACVNRTISNTPLQALTLLNNESFVEAAQSLARRLLAEPAQTDAEPAQMDAERLGQAVRICLCRPPVADELDRLDDLLDSARQYYKSNPEAADAMIGRYTNPAIANTEAAAWAATVRILLNLDEFLTRE